VEPAPEVCDGQDNDCDGTVDEECGGISYICNNGRQDEQEEGIDCGGICPVSCAEQSYFLFLEVAVVVIFVIVFLAYFRIRKTL
jgi:hypothetical protein